MTDAEHQSWHDRWRDGRINFHQPDGNPLLRDHLDALKLPPNARLFLPLCGKTGDINWLLSQGFRVAGAELSRIAIAQLFDELSLEPTIQTTGPLTHFKAHHIDMFVGDVFDLTADTLGAIDAVFDRAALVALPAELRRKYVPHIVQITRNTPQLVIGFDYDASTVSGPPFPVPADEITQHFATHFTVNQLADNNMPGGLKGVTPAREQVWHLSPR